MSNVLEEMKTRRSIRKFKPDAIPQEILDQIIEAGTYAANGRGAQNVIIIQVTNKEKRDEIAKKNAEIMGSEGDPFYGAPAMLIVLGKKDWPTHVFEDEYEGIGHCALGYVDGDYPDVIPRKENRVFYIR